MIEACAARKESKPESSAAEMAAAMGIELLTEKPHRALQQLGELGVGLFFSNRRQAHKKRMNRFTLRGYSEVDAPWWLGTEKMAGRDLKWHGHGNSEDRAHAPAGGWSWGFCTASFGPLNHHHRKDLDDHRTCTHHQTQDAAWQTRGRSKGLGEAHGTGHCVQPGSYRLLLLL